MYLPIDSNNTPPTQLILDMRTGAWGVTGGELSDPSYLNTALFFPHDAGGRRRFFEFGYNVYEMDAATGTVDATTRTVSFQTQPNACGSPGMMKDFERFWLYIKDYSSLQEPVGVQLDFYINQSSTPAFTVTGLHPINGRIDLPITNCTGDSFSFKLTKTITDPIQDGIEVSGYGFVYTTAEAL